MIIPDFITNDETKQYVSGLAQKLERHFDLFFDVTKENEFFDLYAFHQQIFAKSFITRATVYEQYSVFEHLFVRICDFCGPHEVLKFEEMLKKKAKLFAKPNAYHKKSTLAGILVCQKPVTEQTGKAAADFFYREEYKWCFHGWSETTVSLVSLFEQRVYISKKNKDLGKLLSF